MNEPSDDAFQASRQPNGAAATTNTPHSDAVANILAASPDWRMQAGPSPAADAGQVRGQAAGQAADAGQVRGQAASPAAATGQFISQAQAAATGQSIGQVQSASPTSSIHQQSQGQPAATIANQSRTRIRSFAAATDFGEAQFLLNHPHNAYPSPATATAGGATATAATAGLLTPIPRIVITTPDQHIHAPDSPTLHRARQPAHRRPRRQELLNRIHELEARIRAMTNAASTQEMVRDALSVDNAMLVMRVGGLRERVGYLEGQVGRERAVREGWRGRARWAEGVLRVLEGWGGEDEEEGGGMDCG
ncbi:hypothetical protein VE00_02303 [Pseudogymnoascus sp. WSF 3629]|nr:hypothetical protein VE00_02303 [Pseudogymnoascus sp. WSF 3629]